jgi:DNA-binding NarL/FixJ family response regulator
LSVFLERHSCKRREQENAGGPENDVNADEERRLLPAGKTNAEIAEILWIAPGTIRKHLENVYEKLGVHTRTAAVARVRSDR